MTLEDKLLISTIYCLIVWITQGQTAKMGLDFTSSNSERSLWQVSVASLCWWPWRIWLHCLHYQLVLEQTKILRLVLVPRSNLGRGCSHPSSGELLWLYWDYCVLSSLLQDIHWLKYQKILHEWRTTKNQAWKKCQVSVDVVGKWMCLKPHGD